MSVKIGFRSESGQFWECSALERNEMQRKISGAIKSWSVSRIIMVACTGRSLAVLLHLPSAIGIASRRNLFLAGRSLAAYWLPWPICGASRPVFPRSPERDQREPECNDGSSRARSAATSLCVTPAKMLKPAAAGATGEASR